MLNLSPRSSLALLVLPGVFVASGCGRSVAVSWWEPPAAAIGAAQQVVVTDAYGRTDAVDVVARQARDHIRAHGYFEATDRQHRVRLEVDRHGDVWLDNGEGLAVDTVYVRVDVLEWSAFTADTATDTGDTVIVESTTTAHVLLTVTAADRDGLLMDALPVETTAEQAGALSDDDVIALLEGAARDALAQGLADVLPQARSARVPLDDRDQALHPILDAELDPTAKIARLDEILSDEPNHAGAHYNRAVLNEARGAYDAALVDYDAALSLDSTSEMYAESRAACLDRLDAARRLGR